jgi:plasmid stabilization system protein ParE
MTYTVAWIPQAQNRLADIWNRAADRQEVADAADRIDRLLRIDAHRIGRPLGAGRILVAHPLAVSFTVDPGDRAVRILQVHRTR